MNLTFNKTVLALFVAGFNTSALAIDFTDFKTPDSDYEEAYASGALAMQDGGGQAQMSYDVKVNGNYLLRSNTARQTRNFSADASTSISRDSVANADEVSVGNLGLAANVDNYVGLRDDGMFWSAGAGARYQMLANDSDQTQYDASVGIGYGRIYDATPYARAHHLAKKLEKFAITQGLLSNAAMMDVANIVAQEDQYKSRFSTVNAGTAVSYRAKMLADVEQALIGSGQLQANGLGAAGTIYANESLFEETVNPRSHGLLVRAGAAYSASEIDSLSSSEPALKLDLEYALPVGDYGQFTNTLSLLPADEVTRASNTMRYTQELSDNTDWNNAWLMDYQDANDVENTTHTVNSDYVVRIGDNLFYNAGVQLSKSDADDSATVGKDESELSSSLTMGINYRIR